MTQLTIREEIQNAAESEYLDNSGTLTAARRDYYFTLMGKYAEALENAVKTFAMNEYGDTTLGDITLVDTIFREAKINYDRNRNKT